MPAPAGEDADDGWTAVTRDKQLSAQFEHSVGVTETGVEFFTLSPKGLAKPPYDLAAMGEAPRTAFRPEGGTTLPVTVGPERSRHLLVCAMAACFFGLAGTSVR